MKLSGLISPGVWGLVERLRPHLDVSVEVLDASLAPLLPDLGSESVVDAALRSLGDTRGTVGSPAVRDRLLAALRTAQHDIISTGHVRVGVFPLRREREVVGLLLAGAPEDPGAGSDDPVGRRVERTGWSIRAAIEADMVTGQRLSDEEDLARWLSTILRFLQHLDACRSRDELFDSVVQAGAIWGDLDSRIYERTLDARYVIRAALPSLESTGPREFGVAFVEQHPGIAHISSVGELEALGWHPARAEVTLIPVPNDEPARWLLTIGGTVSERLERAFAAVCRTMGSCLTRLETSDVQRLRSRVTARIADPAARFPGQAAAILSEIAAATGAAHARILLASGEQEVPRVLAAVGGAAMASLPFHPPLGEGDTAATLTPARLVCGLARGGPWRALLDLIAASDAPFGVREAALAVDAARVAGVWIDGVVQAQSEGASATLPGLCRVGFEGRIQDEIERARRFGLETGVLLIDPGPSARSRLPPPSLASLVEAVRSGVRTADRMGQLQDGTLALLLVQAGNGGVEAAAARAAQRLAQLARGESCGPVAIGVASYPASGDTARAVLAAAREDLQRRSQRPASDTSMG